MPNVGKLPDRDIPDPANQDPARKPKGKLSTQTDPLPAGGTIKGDMKSEEPLGWDQAPQDIKDPEQKRHSRPDGVGGIEPAEDEAEKDAPSKDEPARDLKSDE